MDTNEDLYECEENTYGQAISERGLELIASFEGYSSQAYYCPAGVLTIGFGHTGTNAHGEPLQETDTVTREQAMELLYQDLAMAEATVNEQDLELTQDQFDALVSFVYNVGSSAFEQSTMLKLLKAGDYDGAAAQFARWNKIKGKVSAGLTARRSVEQELFCGRSMES